VEATLPAMGQEGLTLPPNRSALDSILPSPFTLPPPPAPPMTVETPGPRTEPDPSLLPPPPPTPSKAEQPKAETPKGDLPSDPFSPKE
jgi:hypothetical protein